VRLLLAATLIACAPRPAVVEPAATETPWCMAVTLAWNGRSEAGQACGSTRDVCESVRRRAVRYGAIAKITEVGACMRRGE
jgi:hypothetical protein